MGLCNICCSLVICIGVFVVFVLGGTKWALFAVFLCLMVFMVRYCHEKLLVYRKKADVGALI